MHKRWVVKPVKEKKNYDFLLELQKDVLDLCEGAEDLPDVSVVDLPANIATETAPDKLVLIDQHRTRFYISS